MRPSSKVFLIVEVLVCVGPMFAALFLGLLILPTQLSAVFDGGAGLVFLA